MKSNNDENNQLQIEVEENKLDGQSFTLALLDETLCSIIHPFRA